MKLFKTIVCNLLLVIFFSCQEDNPEIVPPLKLHGSWQLYEQGYSPGWEYIVKEVDADPPIIYTFNEDNTFSPSVAGLEEFRFYKLVNDDQFDQTILTLYQDEPPTDGNNEITSGRSYNVSLKNDILTLRYRFCTEGCHLAFRRIDNKE